MSKVYIGIDIGKQGSFAIMKEGVITTFPMPMIKTELDYSGLCNLLTDAISTDAFGSTVIAHVIFEKLGVIFGSSKQTAFSMGNQAGAVEMACICQNIPYTKVNAKDWQKAMFQGVEEILRAPKPGSKTGKGSRDTKAMALVAVKRIFPKQKLTFGEKATKPHDGLIDAVLMTEYARRNNL